MKRIILLCLTAVVVTTMSACSQPDSVSTTTTAVMPGQSTEAEYTPSASPDEISSDIEGNAKKAVENEWISDLEWTLSEEKNDGPGSDQMVSIKLTNHTQDITFRSVEFYVLPFGVTLTADNMDLKPGSIFDRDKWALPMLTDQVQVCVKSIYYLDSGEKTWENPYLDDWMEVQKAAMKK